MKKRGSGVKKKKDFFNLCGGKIFRPAVDDSGKKYTVVGIVYVDETSHFNRQRCVGIFLILPRRRVGVCVCCWGGGATKNFYCGFLIIETSNNKERGEFHSLCIRVCLSSLSLSLLLSPVAATQHTPHLCRV